MCAIDLHERGLLADDTVVVTVMSNLGFRTGMAERGIHVVDTAVGDRYVLEALDRGPFTLGGEQSGHVIFRELASTGDGLLTGLFLLDLVSRAGRQLADLAAAAMTRLPQVLVNVRTARRDPLVLEQLADDVAAAEARLGGPRPGAAAHQRHRAAGAGDGGGAHRRRGPRGGRGARRPCAAREVGEDHAA